MQAAVEANTYDSLQLYDEGVPRAITANGGQLFYSGDALMVYSNLTTYAQPVDPDLTAIAALATTSYGRNLLTLANQAALQAAVVAAQTGTGSTFVMSASPTLTTPTIARTNLSANTNVSEQASGIVQIGTTAANALGSLACANVTASGTVTTPKVENNASQLTLNGSGRVQFQTGGFDRWQMGPGNDFYPSTTNVYNVGTTSLRVLGYYGGTIDLTGTVTASGTGTHTFGTTNTVTMAAGALVVTATVRLGTYTVATLPSASANTRARAFASDSNLAFNSTNLGSTVTAGGSTLVPVFSNGTNWVIG
jgi:hypothetical protein